ncbi:hypothetical protein B7463_g12501, partial [Scytalidium lignicola]
MAFAMACHHEAVVELLLAKDDVDINSKDNDGQSPLTWAVQNEHEAIIELLLAKNDVDVNSKDNNGRTPLSFAAENGDEAVVKLLLAKDDVDINSKDNDDRTPLSFAAEDGHEAVVKLLFAKDGIDINSKDNYGRTTLLWAAATGHEAVVELLLAKDSVDVNSKDDEHSRTPLLWAVNARQGRHRYRLKGQVGSDAALVSVREWARGRDEAAAIPALAYIADCSDSQPSIVCSVNKSRQQCLLPTVTLAIAAPGTPDGLAAAAIMSVSQGLTQPVNTVTAGFYNVQRTT